MRLGEYIDQKLGTVKGLVKASGVSYQTVKSARRGMLIEKYHVAKAISDATSGAVTIKELCESEQEEKAAT